MGRSIAIRYTVELVIRDAADKLYTCTPAHWRTRARYGVPGYGSPTEANLKAYIVGFEKSTQPSGCNAHLGAQTVVTATIVDQQSRAIVARYAPEMTVPKRD